MRIEQDVRAHAALGEGHVLRGPQATQDTFLTVSAGELVSDGGVSGNTGCDANALEAASASIIAAHLDVVHYTALLVPAEKQSFRNQSNLRNTAALNVKINPVIRRTKRLVAW